MPYTLRDSMVTYQVCLATDLRRPRVLPPQLDLHGLIVLARSLTRDEANERIMRILVEEAIGRAVPEIMLHERFADLVTCGRIVLREIDAPDAYPLPDPYALPPMPLVELLVEEPTDDVSPRTTWSHHDIVIVQPPARYCASA